MPESRIHARRNAPGNEGNPVAADPFAERPA
jgi:hypothetical protein